MPVYVFKCQQCEVERDFILPMAQSQGDRACTCGGAMRRYLQGEVRGARPLSDVHNQPVIIDMLGQGIRTYDNSRVAERELAKEGVRIDTLTDNNYRGISDVQLALEQGNRDIQSGKRKRQRRYFPIRGGGDEYGLENWRARNDR